MKAIARRPLRSLSALKRRSIIDDFSKDVITGAERALLDTENPLRLNAFAAAMRSLFEHLMDRFAPADEVTSCSWFTPQTPTGRPTRAQKIIYAIQGGLTDQYVQGVLRIDVRPLKGKVVEAINEFSKHIHARESSAIRAKLDQDAVASRAVRAFIDFADTLESCRAKIIRPILESLDDAAVDAAVSDSMVEVDALASHFSLDDVYVERTAILKIGPYTIIYRAEGTVGVTLRWGSNSDMRRGDGAELGQSFPFSCDLEVDIDDPRDLSYAEATVAVDVSSWREAMAPDPDDVPDF